jgi:signal transduction histidine kinase
MKAESHTLSLTDRELLYRLGWFTRLRWAMGGLALFALLLSWYVLHVRFRLAGEETLTPAANVVLGIFLYNAVFTFAVHVFQAVGKITRRLLYGLATGQLVCDMIAACALAHYTGGVENFFIILVLMPLVVATELLPRKWTYLAAGAAVAMIHALAWGEQRGWLEHVDPVWSGRATGLYTDPMYVLMVTSAMTITIFAIVFAASSISLRLRQRETDVEEAYLFLRHADEAKSFFMRKAGHEMRAPLSAIHSILGAIEDTSEVLGDEHRRMIARAQHRLHGLMQLVDDLRQYSRLRSVSGFLRIRPVPLDAVVRATVELFRPRADHAKVALTCTLQPVQVEGDEEMLSEATTNLVSNAIQYTPAGGTAHVDLRADHQEAVLTVSDSGIGIGPEAREGLFGEFFRTPEARRRLPEGTGLGLAITRRIVELHQGRIDFAPGEPSGSVFTIRLPLRHRSEHALGLP